MTMTEVGVAASLSVYLSGCPDIAQDNDSGGEIVSGGSWGLWAGCPVGNECRSM